MSLLSFGQESLAAALPHKRACAYRINGGYLINTRVGGQDKILIHLEKLLKWIDRSLGGQP